MLCVRLFHGVRQLFDGLFNIYTKKNLIKIICFFFLIQVSNSLASSRLRGLKGERNTPKVNFN